MARLTGDSAAKLAAAFRLELDEFLVQIAKAVMVGRSDEARFQRPRVRENTRE